MPRYLTALTLTVTLAAACGGGGGYGGSPTAPSTPGTNGGSTTNAISVNDDRFAPNATTVATDATVTWTWTGRNPHNVTFDDGTSSATQQTGTYQRTFGAPGSYGYHCTIHGAAMSGTVTVR